MPNVDTLIEASAALRTSEIKARDFEEAMSRAGEGDLIFVDPPYVTGEVKRVFDRYTSDVFSFSDQLRLADSIAAAAARGAHFVMTNADHPAIQNVFGPLGTCHVVTRPNSVAGSRAARGRASELIFTNIPETR